MKRLKVYVVLTIFLVLGFSAISHAGSGVWPSGRTKNLSIGVDINAANLGVGPLVKYWINDNVGVQGTLVLGYLTGYGARVLYEFDKDILIAGSTMNPYAGIGYTSASREETWSGVDVTTKGSGPQIFGGVEGKIPFWGPNFYWTTEFVYAPIKLEGTAKTTFLGEEISSTVEADYSSFDIGLSLLYYFDKK